MVTLYSPDGENQTAFNQNSKGLMATDNYQGIQQKNARMWQIIALVSLSSFVLSIIVLAYTATLPKTVPVIVTVNDEGKANYAGKVSRSLYNSSSIPEIAKEYVIRELLTDMYTWVMDRDAQNMFIRTANTLVQGNAIGELDMFYRNDNPFQYFGERTRTIKIEPPSKQSERTYITFYTTEEKNESGYTILMFRYRILINLDLYEATVENPLGLYVTHFDIKEVGAN